MVTGPLAVVIVTGNPPWSARARVLVGVDEIVVESDCVVVVVGTAVVAGVSAVADEAAHAVARNPMPATMLINLGGMVLLSLEEPSWKRRYPSSEGRAAHREEGVLAHPSKGFTVAGQRRILTGLRFTHGAGNRSRIPEASTRRENTSLDERT
jgi:hypothetical protein